MTFNPTGPQTFNGVRGQEARVELELNGKRSLLVQQYQVRLSVLTQPGAFSLTLGTSDLLLSLMDIAKPNTPFALRIDGRTIMTGTLDGWSTNGVTGILQVEGRDALAPLHDAYLTEEQSFADDTYASLVRKVMDKVGLQSTKLQFSNRANRAAMLGKDPLEYRVAGSSTATPPARRVEEIALSTGSDPKQHKAQSQLGEKAYEFLKRQLDRAGLFLWAAADGSYVLSEPTTAQASLLLIQRSAGSTPEFSDVTGHTYQNKTAGRYGQYHVYIKSNGQTTQKPKATVTDSEMMGWGLSRAFATRDANATTEKQAEFVARRRMAEARRQGWRLSYTVSEHRSGSKVGGRLVWTPDTMVEVNDKRLGIEGEYWIESVTLAANPQSTTTLELMRPEDLVFGEVPT